MNKDKEVNQCGDGSLTYKSKDEYHYRREI